MPPDPDDIDGLDDHDKDRCRDMDGNKPQYGPPPGDHAGDVAAASAAYLFNLLPAIAALPASEAFWRLETHFLAAIAAYRDARAGWACPDPSAN